MEIALFIAAAAQLVIAVLNLFLVRIMKWEEPVAQMPQLVRDVFHVHSCFITITLVIFGVVTMRFAGELAAGTNDLGRWLVCGIGLFWLIRWVMQFFFLQFQPLERQARRDRRSHRSDPDLWVFRRSVFAGGIWK